MTALLAILLILIFSNAVLIEGVYQNIPLVELRRRARAGQAKHADALYRMMAHSPLLQAAIWLKGTLSATILVIWAARSSWWLAVIAGMLISLVALAGRPRQDLPRWQVGYVSLLSPIGSMALGWIQPVIGRLPGLRTNRRNPKHTGLYEKDDLLELLKQQARQTDNRLNEAQLRAARGALGFGEKIVGQVMTPRSKAKMVLAGETIGPMVMDELHQTRQTRFAVVKEISKAAQPEVVGTLNIQDLLEHLEEHGHIRDLMHPGASFINESQTLNEALEEFLKSGNFLLVAVNNFDEVAGVITVEQVLGQIFGHMPPADGQPENEHSQPPESKVE